MCCEFASSFLVGTLVGDPPKSHGEPGPIRCTAEDDALIVYEGGMAEEAQCTAPPGPVLVKVGGLGDSAGGPAGSGSSGWKWIGFTKYQVGLYHRILWEF